ncbi:MAG TPA: hypothetical protein VN622_02450 [Clostridia bacterium]|nr:hypothetical protein [Clostridia bacterium]
MSVFRPALMLTLFAIVSYSAAREVRYIDLTGVTQRTNLRTIEPPPAKCPDGGSCVGGARGATRWGDCAARFNDPQALRTTITWTDGTTYNEGSSATWEVNLENIGSVEFDVPSSPHLADLQPNDPAEAFKYFSIGLTPYIPLTTGMADLGHVLLYGSTQRSDSFVRLKPGDWIRVKAHTVVKLTSYSNASVSPIEGPIRSRFWIHEVTFSSRAEKDSSITMMSDVGGLCPRAEYIDGPTIRVEPVQKVK